jgi:hypothetical protein
LGGSFGLPAVSNSEGNSEELPFQGLHVLEIHGLTPDVKTRDLEKFVDGFKHLLTLVPTIK